MSTDNTNAAAPADAIASLLTFLDEHNASCPACGYPLRDAGSANCPECGRAVRLRLDDGIDRRSLTRLALWIALIGLIVSGSRLLGIALSLLSTGGGFGLPMRFLLPQLAWVVLLVVSTLAYIRFRRLKTAPASVVLRVTRWYSLAVVVALVLVTVTPVLLGLLVVLANGL